MLLTVKKTYQALGIRYNDYNNKIVESNGRHEYTVMEK